MLSFPLRYIVRLKTMNFGSSSLGEVVREIRVSDHVTLYSILVHPLFLTLSMKQAIE